MLLSSFVVLDIRYNNCFFFVLEKVCQRIEAVWKELLQDQEGTAFPQRNGKDSFPFSPKPAQLTLQPLSVLFILTFFFRLLTGRACRVLLHMEKDSHSVKFPTTQASKT